MTAEQSVPVYGDNGSGCSVGIWKAWDQSRRPFVAIAQRRGAKGWTTAFTCFGALHCLSTHSAPIWIEVQRKCPQQFICTWPWAAGFHTDIVKSAPPRLFTGNTESSLIREFTDTILLCVLLALKRSKPKKKKIEKNLKPCGVHRASQKVRAYCWHSEQLLPLKWGVSAVLRRDKIMMHWDQLLHLRQSTSIVSCWERARNQERRAMCTLSPAPLRISSCHSPRQGTGLHLEMW